MSGWLVVTLRRGLAGKNTTDKLTAAGAQPFSSLLSCSDVHEQRLACGAPARLCLSRTTRLSAAK
jgi:hypothetical protein